MHFDGYRIVRKLHGSSRSHVYLAVDEATDTTVVIKAPSVEVQADAAGTERFLLEEWVAQRIDSPHVLRPCPPARRRNHLYVVMEYIEGRTLAQWMVDHPRPDVQAVRGIIDQVARGLRAFHRLEMLHQDLRPQNLMIDVTGTVKIIDFGSTAVASLREMVQPPSRDSFAGDAAYTAPEYFIGESGTTRSDQFALAVLAYQMLTGQLPYGPRVAHCRSRADARRLAYRSMQDTRRDVPFWIDEAIRRALHPDPDKRYEDVSEFVFSLYQPDKAFLVRKRRPLIERNPVVFWQGVCLILMLAIAVLLATG